MSDESSTDDKKARRQRRKRQRARREILDATRTVLLRDGIDAVTIKSLADELGLSMGALYYYFSSKDELIDVFIRELFDEVYDPMRRAVDEAEDGFPAIEAMMRAMLEQGEASIDSFRALYVAPQLYRLTSPEVMEYFNGKMRALYDAMESKLVAGGLRDLDPRRVVVLAWTSAFGLVSRMSLLDASDMGSVHGFDELLDDLVEIFEHGTRRG